MSVARAVAHNTVIQIVGKIISTILGLVAVGMMTRTLGTEQFGWYVTATGLLQFVGIFSDFGFTVTTSNMLAEPKFAAREILNVSFTWRLLTGLFFYGLAPIAIIFFPYPPAVKWAVFITAFSFLATSLGSIFIAYYRTKLKMFVATASEVVGRLALVVGVAGAVYGHYGFLAIMVAISAASLISLVYLLFTTGGIGLSVQKDISRVMFTKMWPTALAVIFNAFYWQGDRVLLPLFVTQSTVGLYGAAYRVLEIVIQVAAMIMGMVMPLITFAWARGQKENFKQHYQMGFDLLALFMLPMLAGTIVLATPIMHFVAGANFSDAGWILQGLSIAIFGICFGQAFGHVMLAIDQQKKSLWIFVSDAILSTVGYLLFIPRYGISGGIGVTIFSELYAGLGLLLMSGFYSGVWPRFVTFAKIGLACIIMGFIVYVAQPASLLFLVVLGASVYIALLFLFKVVSKQMIKELAKVEVVALNE